jgi:hypothetical protein
MMQDFLTVEQAEEMTDEFLLSHEIDYPDWGDMEEKLRQVPLADRERLACAFATLWRAESDEPGFNQPSGTLVRLVEELIGEAVWPGDDPA